MKAFFGTLIVCVLVVVIAMFGQRLRKARSHAQSYEAEMALMLEENYRTFISNRPPETVSHAARFIEMLPDFLDPKYQYVFTSPQVTERVEAARILAVSNMVAGLEAYSGMSYGTNIQAWQDWLKAQPSEGKRSKKVRQ